MEEPEAAESDGEEQEEEGAEGRGAGPEAMGRRAADGAASGEECREAEDKQLASPTAPAARIFGHITYPPPALNCVL